VARSEMADLRGLQRHVPRLRFAFVVVDGRCSRDVDASREQQRKQKPD
jgi:hypothetical protein